MSDWQAYFYRTSTGDEMDLVLIKGEMKLAIECKASTAPQLSKGFWNVIEDIDPHHVWVVAPINGTYPMKENVTVGGLSEVVSQLKKFK